MERVRFFARTETAIRFRRNSVKKLKHRQSFNYAIYGCTPSSATIFDTPSPTIMSKKDATAFATAWYGNSLNSAHFFWSIELHLQVGPSLLYAFCGLDTRDIVWVTKKYSLPKAWSSGIRENRPELSCAVKAHVLILINYLWGPHCPHWLMLALPWANQ